MAGEVMQFDADAGKYLAEIEKIKQAKMSLRTEIGLLTKAAVGGSKEAEKALEQQTLAVYKLDKAMQGKKDALMQMERASGQFGDSQRRNNTLMVQGAAIIDDFSSQILTAGLGPALRASTNNISFMAQQFGGVWAIAGTVGAVIGSLVIPKLWEMVAGTTATRDITKEATEAIKKNVEWLKQARDATDALSHSQEKAAQIKEDREFDEQMAKVQGEVAPIRQRITEAERLGGLYLEKPEAMSRTYRDDVAKHAELNSQMDELKLQKTLRQKARQTHRDFGKFDSALRSQAEGLLASGVDAAGVKAALTNTLAGQSVAGTAIATEGIDKIISEAQDNRAAAEFKKQFAPEGRMSAEEEQLKKLGIQQTIMQGKRATAELGAMRPDSRGGREITKQERREIDAVYAEPLKQFAAEMLALTAVVAAQRLELEKEKRGTIINVDRDENH